MAHAEPSFLKIQGKANTLKSPAIREASGLACSATDLAFLWIINDSGGTNEVHLADTNGNSRGSVTITRAKNIDWEDLASFTLDGKPYLLIADTGDNASRRTNYTFYIVREPTLPAAGKSISGEIPLAWETTFTLPEGTSADIEAVAIDGKSENILFLTKRLEPAILYAIPLAAQKESPVAEKIAEVIIDAPVLPLVPYRSQPTAMDIAKDNSTAAVITYYGIFLFHRNDEESWAEVFSKRPRSLPAHGLPQAESVAFSKDGKSLYGISEGVNSSIIIWQKTD
ncbi:MAG: hypothetical protein NWT08_07270 [Akkermansiaceae bacterium]|jgi:hypothetical protein|nr:hypothetical protein [Akkermansiaceae bacterium]MDP4720414.1 hypothetical protein [Akkermansiaceae bacterium]MDP4898554.1 hypothetical protein [Akkermansiaceae bacterium]